MKIQSFCTHLFLLLFSITNISFISGHAIAQPAAYGIAIHAGAGHITPERFSEDEINSYEQKLSEALQVGYAVLDNNGSAEDAVTAAITILENSPLFNAGKGSVLTHDETAEMDASIMRGTDLNAGSVAGVMHVKNPILAAQKVMTSSEHVMLSGKGADEFAKSQGLRTEKNDYFIIEERLKGVRNMKKSEKIELKKDQHEGEKGVNSRFLNDEKFGTVGAVALDKKGNLAAGTSTGGMTNKKNNRIGDSPIIGAGTYANNRTCAVSCTGHGEYFIRLSVAHEVSSLIAHKRWDLTKAANYVIHQELKQLGGEGGLISIDRKGNVAMPFNTLGMFRGSKTSISPEKVELFQ